MTARTINAPTVALGSASASADKPVWVQIARAGRFEGYGGGAFEFTPQTFDTIIANFRARPGYDGKRDELPWDFHHASEMSATSGSIPQSGAPAQGWIRDLKTQRGADGVVELWALTRWLEPARTYIKEGRYKHASVSVVLDAIDPVTGRSIGPLLTSVALTNTPFIEGMQQLAASKRSASASSKGNTMSDLEKRIIDRARVLRDETPQPALALSRATAELMPTASNDERHRVWGPLLNQHNLETVRHAIDQGAQLGAGKHASLWRGRRNAEREHEAASVASSDARPVLDVSPQAGATPFAKLLAHVIANNPNKPYDDCAELAMSMNHSHRVIG